MGDSLLHGRRFDELDLKGETRQPGRAEGLRHAYGVEDLEVCHPSLGQQYHVVVGNPPYITVKDQGLNQAYRKRYTTLYRQYSLAVPFTERFFDLAGLWSSPAAGLLRWHDRFVHEARVPPKADRGVLSTH